MKKKIIFAALTVVAGVGCAILGGFQFMVMDVPAALTAWLDFQKVPKDVESLYARDFTGKTKREMLAEFLAVDGGRTNDAGRVYLSVMIPEDAAPRAKELLKEACFSPLELAGMLRKSALDGFASLTSIARSNGSFVQWTD